MATPSVTFNSWTCQFGMLIGHVGNRRLTDTGASDFVARRFQFGSDPQPNSAGPAHNQCLTMIRHVREFMQFNSKKPNPRGAVGCRRIIGRSNGQTNSIVINSPGSARALRDEYGTKKGLLSSLPKGPPNFQLKTSLLAATDAEHRAQQEQYRGGGLGNCGGPWQHAVRFQSHRIGKL